MSKQGDVLDCIPVVMAGYDVVAYFDLDDGSCASVKGNKDHYYNLESNDENGIKRVYQFWFSSSSNLDKFISSPWTYAPKFGGFCSWGTCCERDGWPWSTNHLGPPAGPDPKRCGFRVYNGSLYFNIWSSYDSKFFEDTDRISSAETRWIEWFGSLHAGPFNWDCFSTSGWDYMDCVHDGQELAPTADDVKENNLSSCGVNPSGKPWGWIIGGSIAGFLILCCCGIVACRYYTKRKNNKLKREFEMLNDDKNDGESDGNITDTKTINNGTNDNNKKQTLINNENEDNGNANDDTIR